MNSTAGSSRSTSSRGNPAAYQAMHLQHARQLQHAAACRAIVGSTKQQKPFWWHLSGGGNGCCSQDLVTQHVGSQLPGGGDLRAHCGTRRLSGRQQWRHRFTLAAMRAFVSKYYPSASSRTSRSSAVGFIGLLCIDGSRLALTSANPETGDVHRALMVIQCAHV